MSKYDALWAYIQGRNEETLVLSFADIAQIAGTPLEQRPDQRGICRFYLGAWHYRFLCCWSGCRSLHQIHLLQHGEKRLHRSCAVGLHHQLR